MSVNVGTAIGYLDLDTSKFKAGLKDAQSTLSEFTNQSNNAGTRFEALGSSLKTVGSTITTAVSLPLLALGAGAIKTASDFEASMSKVSALSGATGKDLERLEAKAKEMGATTKFSATESADALSYMALAGWDTEQSISALPGVLDLAASSEMGLAEASDLVTDYLSAFQEEADQAGRMADVLAYAQANSNTTTQQLGEAFKNCAVNANSFGLDIEQTTALLGKLADQGLKGSEAGTALNAVFRDMSSKMKDGAIAIGDTNVKITDANGNFKSMAEIVEGVQKATDGLSESEKMVALQSTFTADSIKAMGILMNTGANDIEAFTNELYNAEGSASKMASTMQDNLKGSIDNMKSAFEGLLITIGQRLIPIFQNLVEGITNVFTWFNNLNPAIQNVIIGVGGFLAILGPLLLIVGNVIIFIVKLSTSISALVTFFSAGGAGAGLLSAAIGALSGPIGIAIAAITALIAVGVLLYNNWDTIKAKCSEVWNSIKETVNTVWNNIKTSTLEIWNNITNTLSSAWNAIKTVATTVWNAIKSVIQTVWNTIKSVVTTGANAVKSVVTTSFNAVKSVVTTIWNSIKTVIQTAWNGIKSVVSTGVNAVKSVITSVWSGLQEILIAPFRAAQSVISGILSGISSAISKVTSAISSVKNAASNVVDKINPFKKNIEISYSQEDINANARFRSDAIDLAKNLVYSDRTAKTSIAESISSVTKSASSMIKNKDVSSVKPGNSVVINNTYNSPKPASIRELKRQDEIQMRRLAMQLNF